MGIEPTSEAWEASILPLNYARSVPSASIIQKLGDVGIAPPSSGTPNPLVAVGNGRS